MSAENILFSKPAQTMDFPKIIPKGVAAYPAGSKSDIFVAAITLPVILLIYVFVRYLRHKVLKETGEGNTRIADF